MTPQSAGTAPPAKTSLSLFHRWLARAVTVEPREIASLVWSFVYFFCVLCSYYIMRPLREEMGVTVGQERLQTLFLMVFLVMLAAVPAFGWVVAQFPRQRIVPVVYGFLIVNLLGFWALFLAEARSPLIASAFFVWVSVFNLFAVSLFWCVMSDRYTSGQAKQIYGFIAAGGSAGAVCGPLITQSLVRPIGAANLLLVSIVFLLGAIICVHRLAPGMPPAQSPEQDGSATQAYGLVAGAQRIWQSSYLLQIAIWVLLANLISTLFYFEQASIVGKTLSERTDRVQLFARMDLSVSILTILAQLSATGILMQRLGVGVCIAALPATAIVGLAALSIAPTLAVIVTVVVIERAVTFAITSPAGRVLFTVVPPEDKYKAQNFIDTVVYRGGDAASGWVFNSLTKTLALPISGLALLTTPFAILWLVLSFVLGHKLAERTDDTSPDGSAI